MRAAFSVLIVTYQGREMVRQCIEAVLDCSDVGTLEIIVSDNGSTDGTAKELMSCFPGATVPMVVLYHPRNMGYLSAQNEAFRHARGDFIVTLNSDVTVCPGWLEKFHDEFVRNPKLGACGVTGTFCSLSSEGGYMGETFDYVDGACAMYRGDLIQRIGLYDPAFHFGYWEDSDLSQRIKQAGYELGRIDLPVKHLGNMTSILVAREGVDIQGFERYNRMLFWRKWPDLLAHRSPVKQILVIRHMALGDVLLATPIIAALALEYPDAKIDVETWLPAVFQGNPQVRAAIEPGKVSGLDYELVIDLNLAYEMHPEKHIVQAYADAAGVEVTGWYPRIYTSAGDREWAEGCTGPGKLAALHVLPEFTPGKTITPELSRATQEYLRGKGWKIVGIDDLTTPTIPRLAAVLERCQLFVGADSGPAHIAQALGIPSVVIFGATDPAKIIFNSPNVQAVTAHPMEVGCLGCHHVDAIPNTGFRCVRTGENYNRCMKRVHPEDVFAAIEAVQHGQ